MHFDKDDEPMTLSTLDTDKSTPVGELHSEILGQIAQYTASQLTKIFKMSLD